eukprot:TRINITY_DN75756_c0_g1_i1.p1 TRINITY_DN75756_c0_g1~~TRINITY_DN75756_c0_g1_i1.p1  ORF type:complete len:296 (+),score=0.98 TRINITY_DN75756_c0_g1_i1:50-937(+)
MDDSLFMQENSLNIPLLGDEAAWVEKPLPLPLPRGNHIFTDMPQDVMHVVISYLSWHEILTLRVLSSDMHSVTVEYQPVLQEVVDSFQSTRVYPHRKDQLVRVWHKMSIPLALMWSASLLVAVLARIMVERTHNTRFITGCFDGLVFIELLTHYALLNYDVWAIRCGARPLVVDDLQWIDANFVCWNGVHVAKITLVVVMQVLDKQIKVIWVVVIVADVIATIAIVIDRGIRVAVSQSAMKVQWHMAQFVLCRNKLLTGVVPKPAKIKTRKRPSFLWTRVNGKLLMVETGEQTAH